LVNVNDVLPEDINQLPFNRNPDARYVAYFNRPLSPAASTTLTDFKGYVFVIYRASRQYLCMADTIFEYAKKIW
jgi:hypothetical protein